ncbi:hypothetical protein PENSPDRAFT_651267 [Peniophora sp. CONT]|nr:hypothetical protein PENSPDRAFT_651267 [Peniophora sp. CONT]
MPSSRPKRPQPKHDDSADLDNDALVTRNSLNGNSRTKRKAKDKLVDVVVEEPIPGTDDDAPMDLGEPELNDEPEEEQGVTRCICGKTGEDGDETGEFMVQCETCDVWQHGQCMGFPTEADLPEGEYHCELCRPDLHVERLEKQKERERTRAARLSRSHSPTTLLKPAKRRNTMNSRAADAYDESLKDIIEASALEHQQRVRSPSAIASPLQEEDLPPPKNTAVKKRKRTDDDAPPTKRTRSASTASDRAPLQREREETPASTAAASAPPRSMPPPAPPKQRNKRGGARKSAKIENTPDLQDAEDAGSTASTAGQRRTASARAKANSKRTNGGGGAGERARGGTRSAAQEAYEDGNGHSAAGIGLPDHLAHLEPLFGPSHNANTNHNHIASSSKSVTGEIEESVRVRWPAKRMSVGDMNKRVRALVEWVGREQASLGERGRRRSALAAVLGGSGDEGKEGETMRMMEELMSELIGFQERFGPGAKGRERRGAS